ncbi:MAG: hypothetical protein IJZ57_11550 [Clostridia bacterium]|nr:hypothetical protein [Clostridia bacterium]
MKDNDFDFDTSELLSSLDKLKAKYSFNFDDEDTAPEIKDEPAPAVEDEPVISIAVDEPEEDIAIEVSPVVEDTHEEEDIVIEKEDADVSDMSWLIDSDEPNDEPEQVEEETIFAPEPEIEEVIQEEPEAEPVIEKAPAEESSGTPWYLTVDEADDEEDNAAPEQTDEPQVYEDISSFEEADDIEEAEEIIAPPVAQPAEDDEDDDFSDLDDDDELVVIRHDAPQKEEEKKEESPFYAAFMESSANESKNVKPPKPVKSPKPAKPVKEPKEKKEKQPKTNKAGKKPRKKLVLNIVVAAVLAVALWACLFVTDILLVSNWSAPFFCQESESYADGSKTYTGAFYQIQISVNEDGSVERVSLPWFAKGPNGDK